MSRFTRRVKTIAALAAVLVVGSSALLLNDGTAAQAAKNVTIAAGGGAAGISVDLFRPDSVVVNVGDTLTATNDYEEPHTLTFIANPADLAGDPIEVAQTPLGTGAAFDGTKTFNSGFLEKGDSYSVTFAKGGAYQFLCLIHPGMNLNVTVVGAGIFTPPVDTAAAAATLKAGIAAGEAATAAVVIPAPSKNANGSSTWTVPTGPAIPFGTSNVSVQRFLPAKLNIAVGDTVKWSDTTPVPHTITFGVDKASPNQINPFMNTSKSASQVFDPNKYINEIISADPAFSGGIETFSLTFNKAGTYSYICLLHADQGMAGVITVGEAGAGGGAITPPNTGDAGLLGESSGTWMIYAGVAMLVASFAAAGGLAFVSRRD